jgi:hypothetical protein
MFLKILAVLSFFIAAQSKAECNFRTADFIDQLNQPSSIEKIIVDIPKSQKYAINSLKILASKTENIAPKLRKKFKADIKVKYKFGECSFSGRVRQNGDYKDHIRLVDGGKVLRSLDVKLKSGNILGAVAFKLLIPDTRGGLNEVLGAIIAQHLGFVAPETFMLDATVNDVSASMLFQEGTEKELLERNGRREGPMFEGDEELLWSFEEYRLLELEPLALSRMVNADWFLKGASSKAISLQSFNLMQYAYLRYGQANQENFFTIIHPNMRKSSTFDDYYFTMLAMSGTHALRPHNRKFYYNSFMAEFEPIYYDGDLNLGLEITTDITGVLRSGLLEKPSQNLLANVKRLKNNQRIKQQFLDRTRLPESVSLDFFNRSLKIFGENVDWLNNRINVDKGKSTIKSARQRLVDSYLAFQKAKGVQQEVIVDLKDYNGTYSAATLTNNQKNLSNSDVASLIKNNKLDGRRATMITPPDSDYDLNKFRIKFANLRAEVFKSPNLKLDVDYENRSISAKQSDSNDWLLIRNASLTNWQVNFEGARHSQLDNDREIQRFNKYGLTGCLNFYNTHFEFVRIVVSDGGCEDSLNIVSSKGKLDSINIKNAKADAIDIDFSHLEVKDISVDVAGNDCFDVSGGDYVIGDFNLQSCSDKGISVGERSSLEAKNTFIDSSMIGISAKDLSTVYLDKVVVNDALYCYEAARKKQEFGGGNLYISQNFCDGGSLTDNESRVKIGL